MRNPMITFGLIGLICSAASGGLAGLLYYLVWLNFTWYLTAIYGVLLFLLVGFTLISYAMFKAALLGEKNVEPDERLSF